MTDFTGEDVMIDEAKVIPTKNKSPKTKTTAELNLDPEHQAYLDKAMEGYFQRMQAGEKIGLNTLLEDAMAAFMRKEREFYLERTQDEANGFYPRKLQLSFAKLKLKVPRVRSGRNAFRPALLPPKWRRVDKDYENLLLAMLANGYSRTQMERALHALDLPYSEDRIAELAALIHERFEIYQKSDLPSTMFTVFIDAYHAKMREDSRMKDICIFTALGINLDGTKSVLGFYVVEGDENQISWGTVFQDLIQRGLRRVLLFVTDDFSGVREMIRKLYPLSDHQLCFVHMQRNLIRHLPKKVYTEVKTPLYAARMSPTKEGAQKHFEEVCAIIERTDRAYAERLRGRASNYLAFQNYPVDVRKFIYTTNAVESLNSGLEYLRHELGGYFPSRESLDTNYFIQLVNLSEAWEERPIPWIRANTYELRQIYTLRFEMKEEARA